MYTMFTLSSLDSVERVCSSVKARDGHAGGVLWQSLSKKADFSHVYRPQRCIKNQEKR